MQTEYLPQCAETFRQRYSVPQKHCWLKKRVAGALVEERTPGGWAWLLLLCIPSSCQIQAVSDNEQMPTKSDVAHHFPVICRLKMVPHLASFLRSQRH
jgi:hypothetical protein